MMSLLCQNCIEILYLKEKKIGKPVATLQNIIHRSSQISIAQIKVLI